MEETKVVQEETKEVEQTTENQNEKGNKEPFQFDYEKLASIVNGKQTATEDSVLKGYFKQQGLSPEEMAQAISTFKEQKAQATPDVTALQSNIAEATQRALNAEVQNHAILMAGELGVETKAMPYLVRMVDVSEVTKDGTVNEEVLKAKLLEIVEAIPSLKKTAQTSSFQAVGVETTKQTQTDDDDLYRIFGVNKK